MKDIINIKSNSNEEKINKKEINENEGSIESFSDISGNLNNEQNLYILIIKLKIYLYKMNKILIILLFSLSICNAELDIIIFQQFQKFITKFNKK